MAPFTCRTLVERRLAPRGTEALDRTMPARGIFAGAVVAIVLGLFAQSVSADDRPAALSDYAVASWGLRDGLPSNVIWAIVQDPQGYLWLGTDGGLVRFDGARFVVVT